MKKILPIIITLSLYSYLNATEYKISINKKHYKNSIIIQENNEIVTEPKTRYLCYDILQENSSSVNGVYSVDIDGDDSFYSPINAYCDMNNGGWTLYDDFGTLSTSRDSINMKGINSITDLTTAGYSHNVEHVNNTGYPTNDEYISFFIGGSMNEEVSRGKINKTLPDYISNIRVEVAVLRTSSDIIDVYFGADHKSTTNITRTGLELSGSGLFQVHENNLTWIDALWIK